MKPKGESLWDKPRKTVEIPSDVNGSYTGMSHDGSRPVQDADDL